MQTTAFSFLGIVWGIFSSCTPSTLEELSELNSSNPEGSLLTQSSDLKMFLNRDRTRDRTDALMEKLLEGFSKPLSSYPLVEISHTQYGKNGLLYRNGIRVPFSGRLIERNSLGVIIFEASFLNGLPHGRHLRKDGNGRVSMESFFDRGKMTGRKTKWWRNGKKSEVEYWGDGQYSGRKVWDEGGRLLRAEMVR